MNKEKNTLCSEHLRIYLMDLLLLFFIDNVVFSVIFSHFSHSTVDIVIDIIVLFFE